MTHSESSAIAAAAGAINVPSYDLNHPLRIAIANEVHSRPFMDIHSPAEVSHLALHDGGNPGLHHLWLASLCQHLGAPAPEANARHFTYDAGVFQLKWERHTEFSSYTLARAINGGEPFAQAPHLLLPQAWLLQLAGHLMVATHVHLARDADHPDEAERVRRYFSGAVVAGAQVVGYRAQVWSDFRIQPDGYSRFLVFDRGLMQMQTGRLVQRIVEIETYRTMALLALPVAQKGQEKLRGLEEELSGIVQALQGSPSTEQDHVLMQQLIALAARAEAGIEASAYRFGAARAYWQIVEARTADLREERIEGSPTIAEFMERRLVPAIEFCQSVNERQQSVAERIGRASDLLRTRVSISQEKQNSAILASLNRRAEVQLRLQQAVEGFSTVAITYYLISLIEHMAKGLADLGVNIHAEQVGAVAIPLVLGAVWVGVRRLRHSIAGRLR